jgi:hypothetical protein
VTDDPVARSALSGIEKSIEDLRSGVKDLVDSVRKTAGLQDELQVELRALRQQVSAYITKDDLTQNKLLAQVALIDVRGQLDREFGNYETVRRNAIGILRAIDAGTASDATLQHAAEQLMIDAPGYWLAAALVALVAWMRDSRADAERALVDAMNLDSCKSEFFFSLVEARYVRQNAAARWIYEYIRALDCRALTTDFTVVLDSVERGAFGGLARDDVRRVCTGWCEQLKQERELAGRQVANWRTFIETQRQSLKDEFDLLPKLYAGSDWSKKLDWLDAATAFGQMDRWVRERFAVTSVRSEDLGASIDDILRGLIAEYDRGEAALLRLAKEWQAAIKHPGSPTKTARKSSRKIPASPVDSDFLALLTKIALSQIDIPTSVSTSQFALTLSRNFIAQAIDELRERSRSGLPTSIEIEIDGWRRAIRPSDVATVLEREYSDFVDREMLRDVNKVKTPWPWQAGKIPLRREAVQDEWQVRKGAGQDKVHRVVTDVHRFFARWHKEMEKAQRCIEFIEAESARVASSPILTESTEVSAHVTVRPPDWDLLPPPAFRFFETTGDDMAGLHGEVE